MTRDMTQGMTRDMTRDITHGMRRGGRTDLGVVSHKGGCVLTPIRCSVNIIYVEHPTSKQVQIQVCTNSHRGHGVSHTLPCTPFTFRIKHDMLYICKQSSTSDTREVGH